MKKRRRFANRIMTMVCAVLIAFSAFFYVPMDVNAQESNELMTINVDGFEPLSEEQYSDISGGTGLELPVYYMCANITNYRSAPLHLYNGSGLNNESLYEVTVDFNITAHVNLAVDNYFYNFCVFYGDKVLIKNANSEAPVGTDHLFQSNVKFLAWGHELRGKPFYISTMVGSTYNATRVITFEYNAHTTLSDISAGGTEAYQNGYQAGFTDGENAGYGSGYSSGFSDGEDFGYNKGFDDGKNSVDTDSYYDSGYQAGQESGYHSGYQDGQASVDTDSIYNSGYQAGKDSVDTDSIYNSGYQAGEDAGFDSGYQAGKDSVDTDSIYNSGYQAGENAGYNSGYQAGKDSVDTDSYYNSGYQAGESAGYQAGVDSVDTDAYYKAGYDAGYQVAYNEGYDNGYDVGYQNAMSRIDSWGADTSDYPILKYSFFDDELRLICDVFTSAPSTSYDSALLCYLDFDVNPNHTYKFVVKTGGATGGASDALYSDFKLNFVIGSNVINVKNNIDETFNFFIPGYNMGSSVLFEAFVYDCVYYGGVSEEDGFLKDMGQIYPTLKNCYIDIYDMGPSGDTQNHIANQTDKLTNGFDNSQGNSVNSDLSSGLNEYQTAEDTLWATATTGLKDFTFFDFASVPAMITGMSFITAIMGSWFNQAGGTSGVGIVLSILFSVVLVAMVLGLYRWYQSRGGKD